MMYDENKWNENEQKNDSVIDSTAEVLEEKGIGEAAEQKNPEAADSEPVQKEPENQNQSYREPYPRGYYENPNPNPAMNRQPQRESGYQRQSYQNPNYQNQNYQYQNRPNYQYQGGQSQPPKKKGSLLKKAALIVAGALLFGGVSGATMFGVNRVAEILFPYENETGRTIKDALRGLETKPANIAMVIGPEGGFSDTEADELKNIGADCVSLGKTILRTETAGMAALAMVMYELEL